MKRLHVLTACYLAVASLVIGFLTGGYLQLVNWTIDFFWQDLPAWLHLPSNWRPILICLPLGLVIGLTQRFLGSYPLTIEQVLVEIKTRGQFDYHRWWQFLVCALLVLGAGGGIGPEASASCMVACMVSWLGCRWKLIMADRDQLATMPMGRQIRAICGRRVRDHQDWVRRPLPEYLPDAKLKKQIYVLLTLVGVVGIIICFKFFPQEGVFGLHRPHMDWQWGGLVVVIPAIVVGWLFGFCFVKLGEICEKTFHNGNHVVIKAVVAGVLMVIGASLTPYALLSGEFFIQSFAHHALSMTPAFLIVAGLVKMVLTNLGFALGWRGGTIFPAIFCSVAMGAALAQAFPWMPRLTATIVVTVAITVILNQPWLTAVILWFLLPLQLAPVVLLLALLTSQAMKRWSVLKP